MVNFTPHKLTGNNDEKNLPIIINIYAYSNDVLRFETTKLRTFGV